MKKVIVIGCPGSGKSTFSRSLHNLTGIPLYHLDMLFWNADRTTVEKSVFLDRLYGILQTDTWILDGNYASTMELRMQACDTVVFLDYPLDVCLEGIKARKGKARSDLPWIETEEVEPEFLSFIKNYHEQSRPRVMELLDTYSEKDIRICSSRTEAEAVLERIKRAVEMEGCK